MTVAHRLSLELRSSKDRIKELESEAAILNAQPMGFYEPSQLVRDARNHGVEIRPIDVNKSAWDCTLGLADVKYHAVRLGLRMTRGLAEKDGNS